MYNMVTTVDDAVLYSRSLLREQNVSDLTKKNMRSEKNKPYTKVLETDHRSKCNFAKI